MLLGYSHIIYKNFDSSLFVIFFLFLFPDFVSFIFLVLHFQDHLGLVFVVIIVVDSPDILFKALMRFV